MIGGGSRLIIELEDPEGVADDETDNDEDGDVGEVVVAGVEDEEDAEDAEDEDVSIRSAQGERMSWDLQRGFCSRIVKASVAAGARDPPCALAMNSVIIVLW